MGLDIRLGPLRADGFNIMRSGVRWLCEPGQYCRPNQIFAYCNLTLEPTGGRLAGPSPFAEELELQIGIASRVGGRVFANAEAARGGYLSIRSVDLWDPDYVVATFEPEDGAGISDASSRARLLALAGRRMTDLADTHSGLLPGWHARSRGWWCDEGETPLTLLALGVCDVTGVMLGEECAFFEMFESVPQAAQMVVVPDHPLAPAVPVLLDQLRRTPAQFDALSEDLQSFFARPNVKPTPNDLSFAGIMLSMMQRNPIRENYSVFTPRGLLSLGPADAVLLSLAVEPTSILRHKKLGCHVHIMRHHQTAAGPAMRAWLSEAFEPVKRSISDIKRDYETMIDSIARTTGGRVIVLNRMSTSGHEDISNYMAFDAPMSDTLTYISAKETNLMLEDIAAEREIYIIDVDAIAADVGGAEHLPDGIHQSGEMQTLLRQELRAALDQIGQSAARTAAVR